MILNFNVVLVQVPPKVDPGQTFAYSSLTRMGREEKLILRCGFHIISEGNRA